jgi:beta-1,2-mannobiose phosphorylase / 1,2-beta-oligomannan phosphorylase
MVTLQRHPTNPILKPDVKHKWEHEGAFNGSVVEHGGKYQMVYRALSPIQQHQGIKMQVSSIGYAQSSDGVNFDEHRQLFAPTEDWEIYGCEDPRITYFDGKFYIFYTALSVYPFAAYGIRTALAITKDFKTFEKYPVSTFNAKAMALFPEKINGKMAALITIDTDLPPAKIGLAYFDNEEDIWSPNYWEEWYDNANAHVVHLLRDFHDQIELGSAPIKTKGGWLVIHSYIRNYMSDEKEFGIEAVLLDLNNPKKIIGRTDYSLLDPEMDYELVGNVENVIFPSGALVKDNKLYVYYGAADTRVGLAFCDLDELLNQLQPKKHLFDVLSAAEKRKLMRFDGNPIIKPTLEVEWRARGTFNPASIYEGGKVHIVYRAQAMDGTSVFGYAVSTDGITIDEDLPEPIYVPREPFEIKEHAEGNSGCEDPRIARIGDRFYMLYTAYDGKNPPAVAMTSIHEDDFLQRRWHWDRPRIISPGDDDKDACIVKNKNGETFLAFHRLNGAIWLEIVDNLEFSDGKYLHGQILAWPREGMWDNVKIGISSPPIETEHGWLLLYHGVSSEDVGNVYKVGAMLLDYDNPFNVLARTDEPIFEPETEYEKVGEVPNVVFPCGAVVIDDVIHVYYGGADKVIGVAAMPLHSLLNLLVPTV